MGKVHKEQGSSLTAGASMQPESAMVNVVAIGQFDSDAFNLSDLEKSGALSAADKNHSAIVALLPRQMAHIALPWGELLVGRDRLQVSATKAPLIRAADLLAKTVDRARDRCRIRAFGINYEAHYNLGSSQARDAFAVRLAPPDAWGGWGKLIRESMQSEDPLTHGGLFVLTMRERFVSDPIIGWYDASLTVSETIPDNKGVRLMTNHHHEYSPKKVRPAEQSEEKWSAHVTATLLEALEASFDASLAKAETIFGELL